MQTVFPTLFRIPPVTNPVKERLETEDGDFIDIDWHYAPGGSGSKLAVVSHGLEGNSRKKYPLGMARILSNHGWDVICLNFRGCSGEPNRLPRLYHSGVTDDLRRIIGHGLEKPYESAALIGFSMGGNQTLKYLGEAPELVPAQVRAAVVFSVPCRLDDSAVVMGRSINRPYMKYFMNGLKEKIREKAIRFPDLIDTQGLDEIMTFKPFDDKYTAPIHGFRDADDYYRRCSSAQFLGQIGVPTLIVQAQDDPFLSASCYPFEAAKQNENLFLEVPEFGGHVGFMGGWLETYYWSEKRTLSFLEATL
jgi:hypothetical protein